MSHHETTVTVINEQLLRFVHELVWHHKLYWKSIMREDIM